MDNYSHPRLMALYDRRAAPIFARTERHSWRADRVANLEYADDRYRALVVVAGDEREADALRGADGAAEGASQRQAPHPARVDDHSAHHDRGRHTLPGAALW